MRSISTAREARADLVRQLHLAQRRRAEARPALGRVGDRLEHRRVGVAVDQRPPRADVVDEAVAVDVDQLGALAAVDEDRVAADRAHRAHGRVDAAGQARERAAVGLLRAAVGERGHQLAAVERLKACRRVSQSLNSSVKYSSRIFLNSVEE